jgi:hypothetical protein
MHFYRRLLVALGGYLTAPQRQNNSRKVYWIGSVVCQIGEEGRGGGGDHSLRAFHDKRDISKQALQLSLLPTVFLTCRL